MTFDDAKALWTAIANGNVLYSEHAPVQRGGNEAHVGYGANGKKQWLNALVLLAIGAAIGYVIALRNAGVRRKT